MLRPRTPLGSKQRSPRPPGWILGRKKKGKREGIRIGKMGKGKGDGE